jgi:hypothetical protein
MVDTTLLIMLSNIDIPKNKIKIDNDYLTIDTLGFGKGKHNNFCIKVGLFFSGNCKPIYCHGIFIFC